MFGASCPPPLVRPLYKVPLYPGGYWWSYQLFASVLLPSLRDYWSTVSSKSAQLSPPPPLVVSVYQVIAIIPDCILQPPHRSPTSFHTCLVLSWEIKMKYYCKVMVIVSFTYKKRLCVGSSSNSLCFSCNVGNFLWLNFCKFMRFTSYWWLW